MRILIDAMGGDNAPEAPVLGAIEAAKTWGSQITLVGRGEEILAVMKNNGIDTLPDGMEIANADDVVDMHDDPANVVRKRKNSSMIVGLKMLADGQGDAFISAGSTGALLTGATLGGSFRPLLSPCTMLIAPIILVVMPQEVWWQYLSWLSLSRYLMSNACAKPSPKLWDVAPCSALPSCIIASMQ